MNDKGEIDQLIKQFFQVFTNKDGQSPDWNAVHQTCILEVLIIKKVGLSQEVYNLDSFIAPRKLILSDGSLVDFEENEIKEETTIIGSIAQRASVYEKSGTLNGNTFRQQGNKLFQLTKTKVGWRICSLIWEDE